MATLNGTTKDLPVPSPRMRNEELFSPKFLVKIVSSKHGAVVASLPDQVSMDLSSDWDTAIGGGGTANTGLGIIAAEALGLSVRTQYSSAQVWSGNSPININIPLQFYADSSSKDEVLSPIIKLVKMALPRMSSDSKSRFAKLGLFVPPGPRIFDINSNANDEISIQLGSFLLFRKVIITNVNPTFISRELHATGFPLKASCDITFRTIFSLTGNEFERMFTL